MKTSLQHFLTELYQIDPSLREHEDELVPLLEQLLKSDPSQTPDADFVAALRLRLKERAAAMGTMPAANRGWSKFFYAFGGAVSAAVILPLVYIAVNQNQTAVPGDNATSLFGYKIEEANDEAFGSLAGIPPAAPMPTGGERSQSGGGGPSNPAISMDSSVSYGMGGGGDAKMIMPYPMTQFEYVYEGEITGLEAQVPVFQRKPGSIQLALSALADRLNLGTIDLSSFRNMTVESINFMQNAPFGYQLYVSLRDATININAQWDQWPQSKCTTEECYQRERVKIGDIPADDVLIKIAQDFLNEHGVDLAHYGSPEVDNNWKRDYERQQDKNLAYVPEVQRVVFPLMIEGEPTYDQGGTKMGISVGVHVKHKRVMDVWGIADRTYVKSDYAGVTDAEQIKSYLTKLDRFNPETMVRGSVEDVKVQTAKVTLGAPVMGYAMFYHYNEGDGTNQELLVPSLIFPVEKVDAPEETYFYRQTVVVPLAKEMLEAQSNVGPVMPFMTEPAIDAPAPRPAE